MEFVVHTIPGSPYGRAVLTTLEEKQAAYRICPVGPGGSASEEHRRRHPFGRIPVLEHDGFVLYETQAILRYLDRVLKEPALTPSKAEDAARMDQVMNVTDWYLFAGVMNVIGFQRVVGPKLFGMVTDEAAIERTLPRARIVFAELARLLGEKPFMAGHLPSLADFHLAPQVDFICGLPEEETLLKPHANLVAWLEMFVARPSMTRTTWERLTARVSQDKHERLVCEGVPPHAAHEA